MISTRLTLLRAIFFFIFLALVTSKQVKKNQPFPLKRTSLNTLPLNSDKRNPEDEGCKAGNEILKAGETRKAGCGYLECKLENNYLELLLISCDISPDELEDGCEMLPSTYVEFPKCCERVISCKTVQVVLVPTSQNQINLTDVQVNNTMSQIYEPDNNVKTNENAEIRPTGALILNRRKREAAEESIPAGELSHSQCVIGNVTITITGDLPPQGCGKRKCVFDGKDLSIIDVSCNHSPANTPKNCVSVQTSAKPYPECCAVEFVCTQVITNVYPVFVTAANISEININKSENLVDISNKFVDGLKPTKTVNQEAPQDFSRTSDTREDIFVTRQRREVNETTPLSEDLGDKVGCKLRNQTLMVGENIPLKNCAQLRCQFDNNSTWLSVVSCGHNETQTPEGCKVAPSNESFPECCVVKYVCEKVVQFYVPVKTENNNQLEKYEKDNIVGSDRRIFATDYLKIKALKHKDQEGFRTSSDVIRVDRDKRDVDLIANSSPEVAGESCGIGNKTLIVGETLPLVNCALMTCKSNENGSFLIIESCNPLQTEVEEGCKVEQTTDEQYPSCCLVNIICTKVITELIPIVSNFASINSLVNVDTSNVKKEKDSSSFEKGGPNGNNFESFSATRQKRQTNPILTSKNSTEDQLQGCTVGNVTLKLEESISFGECGQLKCILGDKGPDIKNISCPLTPNDVDENCEIQPVPKVEFPKCCIRVIACKTIHTERVPIINQSSSLEDLESVDVGLGNDINLENSLQERRKRDIENQTVEESCNEGNITLKIGDHLPAKGCAQLKCISGPDGPALVIVSCDMSKDHVSNKCELLPPASLLFPKCCIRVIKCTNTVTKLVVPESLDAYDSIKDLASNHVFESDQANDMKQPDNEMNTELGQTNSSNQEKVLPNRKKRETTNVHIGTTTTEGCVLGNQTIQKGQFLYMEDECAQVGCQVENNTMVLVFKRCNMTVEEPPEGCTLQTTPKQQYPECCVVEMQCVKAHTKTIPLVFNSAKISQLETADTNKNVKGSKNKNRFGANTETTESKFSEATESDSESKDNEKVKNPSNNRLKNYDYKQFIERSRRYERPRANNRAKPTFILPPRQRGRGRSRNTIPGTYHPIDDQIAVELRNRLLVTALPLNNTEAKDENTKKSTLSRREQIKKRRRLSSLLSRHLRKNLKNSTTSDTEDDKITKKSSETKKNEKKQSLNDGKTNLRQTSRRRNRNRDITASIEPNIPHRRRFSVERFNRQRRIKKLDENENQKYEKVDKENKKKNNKKNRMELKNQEPQKLQKTDENKEKIRQKLIQRNFSLSQRRRNERRKRLNKKDGNGEKEKKKEESTITPDKVNAETKKEAKSKEEKKTKTDIISKFHRRRQRPILASIKQSNISKKTVDKKTPTITITKKPSFTLTTSEVKESKDVKPVSDLSRGRNTFNLPQPTKKIASSRSSSRSRLLRKRLENEQKKAVEDDIKDTKEGDQQKTQNVDKKENQPKILKIIRKPKTPEPIQILPPRLSVAEINNEPLENIDSEFSTEHPYLENLESTLADIEKFYTLSKDNDLDLSSSDKDPTKTPDTEENEIPEIPDVPDAPMKITTLSFTTSRRSFKSSKTRNTSKNFKEAPTVFGSEETYKSSSFR